MKSQPSNPLCYTCKFRKDIAGDAHSQCNISTPMSMGMVFNIEANQHGIDSGWFFWPFNFDPVWLENCDAYRKKE